MRDIPYMLNGFALALLTSGGITVNGEATFTLAPSGTSGITVNGSAAVSGSGVARPVSLGSGASISITGPVTGALELGAGAEATIVGAVTADLTVGSGASAGITGALTGKLSITGGEVSVGGALSLSTGTSITTGYLDVGGDLTIAEALVLGSGATLNFTSGTFTPSGSFDVTAPKITIGGIDELVYSAASPVGLATLQAALATLASDVNTTLVNLAPTFSTHPSLDAYGIGGVLIASTGATNVQPTADGSGSGNITLVADINGGSGTFSTPYKYSDSGLSGIAWAFDSGVLKVTDAAWETTGTDKVAIYTISGVSLEEDGVTVALPDFNVGVKTKR
jgi:hypothetical protein